MTTFTDTNPPHIVRSDTNYGPVDVVFGLNNDGRYEAVVRLGVGRTAELEV